MSVTAIPEEPAADLPSRVLVARLVRDHVRRHAGRIAFAVGCMGIVAAATAANAWMMEPVLDEVFFNQDPRMLWLVPLGIVVIAILKGFATYGQAYLMNVVGQRIIAEVQLGLFAHLMRADLAQLHTLTTGRLISSFLNDVNLLREAVAKAITGIAKDSLMLAFLAAVMVYQEWRLALVTFVVFPLAILPVRNIGRRMRKASKSMQVRTGTLSALLTEALRGARHVKAYGMEAYETRRADAAIESRLAAIFKAVRARAAATPLMEAVGGLAIALAILYWGFRVTEGETTPGTFASFVTALIMAYQPLKSLANLNAALQEGLAAAQRVFALLDSQPAVRDAAASGPLTVGEGAIEFDDVTFAYADDAPALHHVSFRVPAGTTVALVGPSGAGKSTALNLIPRFYDASAGRVCIDGTDVRDVTLASLRQAIGLVSQETGLFNDTVRANIAYGRAGAAEGEIEAAARAAAAHGFIVRFAEGYDTVVGEDGVKLSGGQRQRIAIARAMLKNAPILLLDEATSALDLEAERKVQSALTELMRGRTTLVVAHRLSTIVDADVIYVIDGGRIAERGRHAELVARGGLYARLYALEGAESDGEEPAARARV